MKRERLNVKEVNLFKAVDRWASKEVERQGLTPDGEVKRKILGEEIVKSVRFPLMSQKEFASVVFDLDILTKKETGLMFKHYSDVHVKSPFPFMASPRIWPFHRCYRFAVVNPPRVSSGPWVHQGTNPYTLKLTVNKPVMLYGVQHFGSEGGQYTVSLEVKDTRRGCSLVQQSGSHSSVKDEKHAFYGFDIMFDCPVSLEQNRVYEIVSVSEGPVSWYGEDRQESDDFQGIRFSFDFSCVISTSRGVISAFLIRPR